MAAPVWNTNDVPTATEFNVWLTNIITAIKGSDESVTSSTALQNDDELVLALAANSVYWLDCHIVYTGSGSGDIKVGFTGPSGTTLQLHGNGLDTTAASNVDSNVQILDALSTGFGWGLLGGTTCTLKLSGRVSISSTAGNLQLQWAQNASNATATVVKAGSCMTARRIS